MVRFLNFAFIAIFLLIQVDPDGAPLMDGYLGVRIAFYASVAGMIFSVVRMLIPTNDDHTVAWVGVPSSRYHAVLDRGVPASFRRLAGKTSS